jgi:hypothetical protein
MKKPRWTPGDEVEFAPNFFRGVKAKWFPAVVDSHPKLLPSGNWVVHLRELPDEFGQYVNLPGRTRMVAAECIQHLRPRRRKGPP